jgi:PIN domain nuclease of toxin-antitoxin system
VPAFILDSSVILAVLRNERGGRTAAEFALDSTMSSVNVAEVVTKCVELGVPPDAAIAFIGDRNITVVDFGYDDATFTGRLQVVAPKGVLSLGDRACIATAVRLNATAVTADRVWATLDLDCPVELIR